VTGVTVIPGHFRYVGVAERNSRAAGRVREEVDMATSQTRSAERSPHPFFEKLGAAAGQGVFAYSVKVVCGKQPEANCCCVSGVRPGVYSTEVNIQNLNRVTAPVVKLVLPLINSGAVVGREPSIVDPNGTGVLLGRQLESIQLPPLAATMDDCCHIVEMLLGAPPSGDMGLTIAILTIASTVELSVSAVYTANPLGGDGISIDVQYIRPHQL
jgi:hypothetical protein